MYISFIKKHEQSRQDLEMNFCSESGDRDNDLNNSEFLNLDNIIVYRSPTVLNEVSNGKDIDEDFDKKTVFKF